MADHDSELSGVGGWLLFFIIVLAVLSPLRILFESVALLAQDGEMAAILGPDWPRIRNFEWALAIATIAFFWYLAWRLVKDHRWRTVQIVIAGLWLSGPGMILLELAGIAALTDIGLAALGAELTLAVIQPVIFCIVWTAYLLKSERVANTYARPGHPGDVGQVFG